MTNLDKALVDLSISGIWTRIVVYRVHSGFIIIDLFVSAVSRYDVFWRSRLNRRAASRP